MRDNADRFSEANCAILGASFDTSEENLAFADAQGFSYPLLSDGDRSVGSAYGVVRPATDQYAAFPKRLSFLIDDVGTIRRTYVVADVATHAADVLADLVELLRA